MKTYHNRTTGAVRTAPDGFSWTTLFFGPLPAACRGDWRWFFVQILIGIATVGISFLVFPFIYNGLHQTWLAENGFREVPLSNMIAQTQPISTINNTTND